MIDLPLLEQVDRMLWAILVGTLVVPLWQLVALIGKRRGLWRAVLEICVLLLLSGLCAGALFVGTLGDLRAYVFVGFVLGAGISVGLLGLLRMPWQESRHKHRI